MCRTSRKPHLHLLAALLVLTLTVAVPTAAGGTGRTEKIVLTGDLLPDGSGTIGQFRLNISNLNNEGEIAFRAPLTGTPGGMEDDMGFFIGSVGSLKQVARKGQLVEGREIAALDLSTYRPSLNNYGQVVARAWLDGASPEEPDPTIILWTGTELRRVATLGDPVPGGNGEFGFHGSALINDAGQAVVVAELQNTAGGAADNLLMLLYEDDVLVPLVRRGDLSPDGSGTFQYFGGVINSSGTVGISAILSQTEVFGTFNAIYRATPQELTELVRLPTDRIQMNDSGDVAFATNSGVYRANETELVRIAHSSPNFVSLNNARQVAFTTGDHVYRGSGGPLDSIVQQGAQDPHGDGSLSGFGSVLLNDAGVVLFAARLPIMNPYPVDPRAVFGFYLSDGEDIVRVARELQEYDGSVIASAQYWFLLDDGSGGHSLNDYGQAVYFAQLADGRTGLFLFTPDLRWRREVSGDWDDADNWTLTLPPAHVHAVSVNPDVDLTVAGPLSDRVVRALAVGGGAGAARVELGAGVRVEVMEELSVAGNGVVVSAGALDVGAVAVEVGGRVEISSGHVLVRSGSVESVAGLVQAGRTEGWGMVSGSEEGKVLGYGPVEEGVVVKQTWGGDATLDGAVTIADLGVLAGNWQGEGKLWFEGDFNGDGVVDIADLGILAGNWQAGAASGGLSFEEALGMFDVFRGVVVPEPGVWGVVMGLGMMGMRRGRIRPR
jgi:hypothetical protein